MMENEQLAFTFLHSITKNEVTPQERNAAYANILTIKDYDTDIIASTGYTGPRSAAETIAKYYRGNGKLLDVAAGSGAVASHLKALGFDNIDALDASHEMLQTAKPKGLYQNFYVAELGKVKTDIESDTYDVVVSSGAFSPGHISCEALNELLRITKPSGYICIVSREQYLCGANDYSNKINDLLRQLDESGAWKLIEKTRLPKYCNNVIGVLYLWQVSVSGEATTPNDTSIYTR